MKPIFNALEFDGINSMQHSIFITGESVYDAPERDVESVEIAGRSGNVLIDNGRWKNLEVTYHAGTFGSDQDEFASKIRNFRNLLASRYGYHRLMDTYNPEEYRIGRFKSVEVEAEGRKRAGEFDITFDCKPQRYLTSGESGVTVSNGESLYNPTPYDASPLLAVQGYGNISFNGYEIDLENAMMGTVELKGKTSVAETASFQVSRASYNTGDTITLDSSSIRVQLSGNSSGNLVVATRDLADSNEAFNTSASHTSRLVTFTSEVIPIQFTAGTTKTVRNNFTAYVDYGTQPVGTTQITISTTITYRSNASGDSFTFTVEVYDSGGLFSQNSTQASYGKITVDSTISLLGDPTYIDCDLGDAYMIRDGEYISLNSYIDLGSDLPVLASGNNEITIDNTITELKVTPRWWIL